MAKGKSSNKMQSFYIILGLIIFVAVIVLVFYASKIYLNQNNTEVKTITNTITMNYTSKVNGVVLTENKKYSDEEGKKLVEGENVFDFVVNAKIKNSTSAKYKIIAEKDGNSKIPDDKIKVYLQKSDISNYTSLKEVFSPKVFQSDNKGMILEDGLFKKTTTTYYRLKVWIDSSYTSTEETGAFSLKVTVYGEA